MHKSSANKRVASTWSIITAIAVMFSTRTLPVLQLNEKTVCESYTLLRITEENLQVLYLS